MEDLGDVSQHTTSVDNNTDLPATNASTNSPSPFNFFEWGFNVIRQPSLTRDGSLVNCSTSDSVPVDLDPLSKEIEMYERDTYEKRKASPYKWWAANAYRLPLLSKLAMKFLSTPPSSVESERVFSIGTQIYSPKRSRIGGKTAEMLMYIVYNLKYFDYNYNYAFKLWKKTNR